MSSSAACGDVAVLVAGLAAETEVKEPIRMRWTYVTGQCIIASGALGCIVPDVGNNVFKIITLPTDAALSENDFTLVKNYATSTRKLDPWLCQWLEFTKLDCITICGADVIDRQSSGCWTTKSVIKPTGNPEDISRETTRLAANQLERTTTFSIGCLTLSLPFQYLGVNIGSHMSRIKSWDIVHNKVQGRLSKWKSKVLSVGGRLTLLKSVLGATPIYYMSMYKAPMYVINKLEAIRSHFFNGGDPNIRKMTFVK
ncbi:hypothetical protein Tco_0010445 [Tanacetum coccineum]